MRREARSTGFRRILSETFCESFLGGVPAAERAALKDEAATALEATNRDAAGGWSVDYVRLRVAAHK